MDFGKAFSYVFDDADWVRKILLSALITLIPIIGEIYLLGWMLEITRRVIHHDPYPLPDVDFGGYLTTGFKMFVVGLVYALPIIIISGGLNIIIAALDYNNTGNEVGLAVTMLSLCVGLFSFVYGILMSLMMYAAEGNVAAKGNIADGLRFGELFSLLKANPGAYVIVLLGSIVAGLVAGLGIIACGIGVLATSAYASAVIAHLTGQAYNQARANLPAPAVYPQSQQTF